MEYRLFIDADVLEVVDGLPKRTRRRLLDQFHQIRSFPGKYSDYHETDAVGRRVEIRIFSGWAIHYWDDFADRHIKILAIRSADT